MKKKCTKCGFQKTRSPNGSLVCKECDRRRIKKWYQKNKEYKKAYVKKWQKENPEKTKGYKRQSIDPDYAREYNKQRWRKKYNEEPIFKLKEKIRVEVLSKS